MTYNPDTDPLRARLTVAVKRYLRVILARPELCTTDHDEQAYQLARLLGHHVISYRRDLCPGEGMRY